MNSQIPFAHFHLAWLCESWKAPQQFFCGSGTKPLRKSEKLRSNFMVDIWIPWDSVVFFWGKSPREMVGQCGSTDHGWWYDDSPQNRRKTVVQPLNHQTSASAFEVTSALETPLCVVAQQYHKSHKSIVVEREWCHMFWHSWVYSVLNKTVRPLLTFKFISSAFSVRLPDPPSVM